jgi:hypothetical protein
LFIGDTKHCTLLLAPTSARRGKTPQTRLLGRGEEACFFLFYHFKKIKNLKKKKRRAGRMVIRSYALVLQKILNF